MACKVGDRHAQMFAQKKHNKRMLAMHNTGAQTKTILSPKVPHPLLSSHLLHIDQLKDTLQGQLVHIPCQALF